MLNIVFKYSTRSHFAAVIGANRFQTARLLDLYAKHVYAPLLCATLYIVLHV